MGARLRGGEDGSSLGDNSERLRLRSEGVVAAVGGLGEGSGWWTVFPLLMPRRQIFFVRALDGRPTENLNFSSRRRN